MSFKLLAIRPLEGTDPKFLKNLRPNCIYKFYNEYHYLDEHGNRLDEYKDDQEFIDYSEVVNITKSETVPQNLYGENINISALVGKNGSGKSSLLEMLYHHISCFEVNTTFDNSEIEIFIEIEFNIYIIKSVIKSPGPSGTSMISSIIIFKKNDKAFFELNVKINKKEINKIKKSFFTNVINYSVYGLNETIGGEWLNKIFHKNDAYTTPITINPHRVNGNIDVNKEYLLAQQRLILNQYVIKKKELIENVSIKNVNYYLNSKTIQKILNKENDNYFEEIPTIEYIHNLINSLYGESDENRINQFVDLIFDTFSIKNSFQRSNLKDIISKVPNNFWVYEYYKSTQLLTTLHNIDDGENNLNYLCFLYIIKKIFKISNTYIKFRKYIHILNIGFNKKVLKNRDSILMDFEKYLIELKNNNDHITFKLKQALSYFETDIFKKISTATIVKDKVIERTKLEINDYINDKTKIEDIPLAMFDHEIIIDKKGKKIDFKNLSSGEQQKIHTILNVVYHAYNITSKNEDERYKNMNLIFDEVELYFHPEFQRTFISDLLAALKFFDGKLNFNILFSTHSPFILSDIPSQNILKLEDGKPKKDGDNKNSFGANIHDLLADEFFLEKGFMGEFAKEYINFVYKEITELNDIDFKKYDELKSKIQIIGEPVLRNPILKLLDEKLSKHNEKNDLINYYKQLIQKLEE